MIEFFKKRPASGGGQKRRTPLESLNELLDGDSVSGSVKIYAGGDHNSVAARGRTRIYPNGNGAYVSLPGLVGNIDYAQLRAECAGVTGAMEVYFQTPSGLYVVCGTPTPKKVAVKPSLGSDLADQLDFTEGDNRRFVHFSPDAQPKKDDHRNYKRIAMQGGRNPSMGKVDMTVLIRPYDTSSFTDIRGRFLVERNDGGRDEPVPFLIPDESELTLDPEKGLRLARRFLHPDGDIKQGFAGDGHLDFFQFKEAEKTQLTEVPRAIRVTSYGRIRTLVPANDTDKVHLFDKFTCGHPTVKGAKGKSIRFGMEKDGGPEEYWVVSDHGDTPIMYKVQLERAGQKSSFFKPVTGSFAFEGEKVPLDNYSGRGLSVKLDRKQLELLLGQEVTEEAFAHLEDQARKYASEILTTKRDQPFNHDLLSQLREKRVQATIFPKVDANALRVSDGKPERYVPNTPPYIPVLGSPVNVFYADDALHLGIDVTHMAETMPFPEMPDVMAWRTLQDGMAHPDIQQIVTCIDGYYGFRDKQQKEAVRSGKRAAAVQAKADAATGNTSGTKKAKVKKAAKKKAAKKDGKSKTKKVANSATTRSGAMSTAVGFVANLLS